MFNDPFRTVVPFRRQITWIPGQITRISATDYWIRGQITRIPGQITWTRGQITWIPGQITWIPGQITWIPGRLPGGRLRYMSHLRQMICMIYAHYSSTTVQQHNSTTVQQYSSTAVQLMAYIC